MGKVGKTKGRAETKTTNQPETPAGPHVVHRRPQARRRVAVVASAPVRFTDIERSQLCIETLLSLHTIKRYEAGEAVTTRTKIVLERAMQKRGIQRRAVDTGKAA